MTDVEEIAKTALEPALFMSGRFKERMIGVVAQAIRDAEVAALKEAARAAKAWIDAGRGGSYGETFGAEAVVRILERLIAEKEKHG